MHWIFLLPLQRSWNSKPWVEREAGMGTPGLPHHIHDWLLHWLCLCSFPTLGGNASWSHAKSARGYCFKFQSVDDFQCVEVIPIHLHVNWISWTVLDLCCCGIAWKYFWLHFYSRNKRKKFKRNWISLFRAGLTWRGRKSLNISYFCEKKCKI